MRKQKVLLISVLKPVDEPRMYEKIGLSLAKNLHLEVHIAGNKPSKQNHHSLVNFHALYSFDRSSLKRLIAPFQAFAFLLRLKPDIVIVTTHELLTPVVVYKILRGSKIIYDIQENYYRNILFGSNYIGIRILLANYIRLKERIMHPFFDKYFLAESCYSSEMHWTSVKSIILENKALPTKFKAMAKEPGLRLIYTGILGETYGTLEAIQLAKKLLDIESGTFIIVGYSPDKKYLGKIISAIEGFENITLIGGSEFVDHDVLMEESSKANLAIISYQNNLSIVDKLPTRMYEYLVLNLPMIIPENPKWEVMCQSYNAAILCDFSNPDAIHILKQWKNQEFYTADPTHLSSWITEELKLQDSIDNLLS